jgi:hypothetical protein
MVSIRRAGARRCRFMFESIAHGYDACETSSGGVMMEPMKRPDTWHEAQDVRAVRGYGVSEVSLIHERPERL